MKFEWDAAKNRANLEKHGISFEEARIIFDGDVLTLEDKRYDYGEKREVSIGYIASQLLVAVVHTDRQGAVRIISARLANRFERRLFHDYFA